MCISPVTDPSHGIAHFKVERDFFCQEQTNIFVVFIMPSVQVIKMYSFIC